MNYKKIIMNWLPVVLWVGFTYWMSTGTFASNNTSGVVAKILRHLIPTLSEADGRMIHGVIRKCMHVTEYFVLGLLLFRAIQSDFSRIRVSRSLLYTILIVVVCAAGDEFHQSFVPSRTATISDVGFDTAGGILAVLVILVWNRLHPPQKVV